MNMADDRKEPENHSHARKTAFDAFSEEVRQLRKQWVYWDELFGKDPQRAPNGVLASSEVILYFQWQALRCIVLDACKLADKPRPMGQENLSIARVFEEAAPALAASNGWATVAESRMKQVQNLVNGVGGLSPLRNKVLAHVDYETAQGLREFPDVDIDRVHHAVDVIAGFQHAIACAQAGIRFNPEDPGIYPSREEERSWRSEARRLAALIRAGAAASAAGTAESASHP